MRWILLFSVLLVLGALAGLGLHARAVVLDVVSEAKLGRDDLLAGARIIKDRGTSINTQQAAGAADDFKRGKSHLTHVHGVLNEDPLIHVASLFPWTSRQIRAANDLNEMGLHLARTGEIAVTVLDTAFTEQPKVAGHPALGPGEKLLKTLDALDPRLDALYSELSLAVRDRSRIPSKGLLPQLSAAVSQLDRSVDLQGVRQSLQSLRAQEPGLRALLGADGPRAYLVMNQDPAELRATGGFIGTVGFLSFDHGKMSPFNPVNVSTIDKLPDGATDVLGGPGTSSHVDPPYPMEYVFHLRSWELRDANWSPDFPTAAQEAEFLLNRERGKRVDGVVAIDPFLIQRLLALIGPLRVEVTGDVVDQNNFYGITLSRRELGGTNQRDSFLPAASKQILTAVLSLPSAKWPALLQALLSACQGRSLQAYFHDAAAEALANSNDCGGEVRTSVHDSLMIVESNVGGNKDDFWMKRQYSLKIAMSPDGSTHHTLRLHYYGLSSHGVALTGYWGYTGWLRVYLPPNTSVGGVTGATLRSTSELGHLMMQGWFYVQFGHSTDVTISYEEPATLNTAVDAFNLYWQKQAGRLADPISVEVVLPAGWKLLGGQVGVYPRADGPVSSDLAVSREFTFQYEKG